VSSWWMSWNLAYVTCSRRDSWMQSAPDHNSKRLSDELANHLRTTFSAIWDASVVVILDDLCHQMSSQMKARVWRCIHKLNHAFHHSSSVRMNNRASGSPAGICDMNMSAVLFWTGTVCLLECLGVLTLVARARGGTFQALSPRYGYSNAS